MRGGGVRMFCDRHPLNIFRGEGGLVDGFGRGWWVGGLGRGVRVFGCFTRDTHRKF